MWGNAAGMQTLTLVEEDEGEEEEEQWERLGPVELSWCENEHLLWVFPLSP